MGQSRPLFVFFVLFTFQFKWQIYNLNNINWKKRRWCAWDLNPGRHDGRRRQIHWAIAAPRNFQCLVDDISSLSSTLVAFYPFCLFSRIEAKYGKWLFMARQRLLLKICHLTQSSFDVSIQKANFKGILASSSPADFGRRPQLTLGHLWPANIPNQWI